MEQGGVTLFANFATQACFLGAILCLVPGFETMETQTFARE